MAKAKHNFVAKHMNAFNKHAVHVDRRRLQLLADEAHCQEGLQEYADEESEYDKVPNIESVKCPT